MRPLAKPSRTCIQKTSKSECQQQEDSLSPSLSLPPSLPLSFSLALSLPLLVFAGAATVLYQSEEHGIGNRKAISAVTDESDDADGPQFLSLQGGQAQEFRFRV